MMVLTPVNATDTKAPTRHGRSSRGVFFERFWIVDKVVNGDGSSQNDVGQRLLDNPVTWKQRIPSFD
jgi:hypothetical protein